MIPFDFVYFIQCRLWLHLLTTFPALRIPGFCSVVVFLCKIHRATNKFMFSGSRVSSPSPSLSHTHKLNTFMSLASYLKIRNLFGIGESLCFSLFYVQTLPILTNFYIHAKHKHTLPSFKFIVHQYWIRKKLEPSVCRVRRVGVFDFGTGWVGYLQKSSGIGTGRDG